MTGTITYQTRLDEITPEHLTGGFFVGWPNPPAPAVHLTMLRQSSHVVLALDGEQVIGFITALSDGVLAAYLPLLEVLPAYQGRGIGTKLVRRILAELGDIYMIDLLCDKTLQPFYARLGMQPVPGMAFRNFTTQNGVRAAASSTD